MGQNTRGVYPAKNGTWYVNKQWRGNRLFQRGFPNFDDAERWLIAQLTAKREVSIHGQRACRTFEDAAAHYLSLFESKVSIETEIYLLNSLMPYIGTLALGDVHDDTLAPYKTARLELGRSHKTVNLAVGVVRHILNLAATSWRDENGMTWLPAAPKLSMLPLIGHQREPRPITWGEQRKLMPELPDYLARMGLFVTNTAARDDVVCSLQWEWEIKIPELGVSVFEVPREHVKGRKRSRIIVCNSVAQSIVDSQRGKHPTHVFVWRREKIKGPTPANRPYHPIQTMNNTAWQSARKRTGLGDLHVHDLRHTAGMRLREVGVSSETRSDIFWHNSPSMTHHYSVAQIVEIRDALEKIASDSGAWNKSLATLRREQAELSRANLAHQEKTD